jgi:peptidoglycan/LPS O-acetylase OafA/YrhL
MPLSPRSTRVGPESEDRLRSTLGYRPALDGIRGLAIVGVLMLHSTIWGAMPSLLPGGNLGVTVFFVLSGYLITTLLLREHERTGGIDLRAFYVRRTARLLPGLLVLLPVYVIVFSRQQTAWQLVLLVGPVLLYLSSFVQAIWGAMGPLAWTWSLSVEEHFYAFWPWVLRWLLNGRADRRAGVRGWVRRHPLGLAACGAVIMICVAVGLRIYLAGSYRWDTFAYYATPTRLDALACGCLAALLGHRYRRPLPRLAGWAALAVIGWCYANPEFTIGTDELNLYGLPLCEVAACVLIVSVVNRPDGLLARALSFRPLVHLGVISYGLYLWNLLPGQTWTLILGRHAGTAGTVALFGIMFVAVELSYRYVERPVLRWAKARLAAGGGGVVAGRAYGAVGARRLAREGAGR